MKKMYFVLFAILPMLCMATTFPGNGNSGFGGPIGKSSLQITDDGTNINFVLTKGGGNFNDVMVIYFDSQSGGYNTTSVFTDHSSGDGSRIAISGYSGSNRATINFNSGFTADYALAIGPTATGFAGLYTLNTGVFGFVSSVSLSSYSNTASTYSFSIPAASIGIASSNFSFGFVATYISISAYLSDESIGASLTSGNQGYITASAATNDTYVSTSLLPVNILAFNGNLQNGNANLTWTTANESNLANFDVEQSTDGTTWKKVGSVTALDNATGSNYRFSMPNVSSSLNLFRLKENDKDGKFSYSSIVKINPTNTAADFNVYPNPISNNTIHLQLNNLLAGTYKISIYNAAGQMVYTTSIMYNGGSSTQTIMPSNLTKGMYELSAKSSQANYQVKLAVQ